MNNANRNKKNEINELPNRKKESVTLDQLRIQIEHAWNRDRDASIVDNLASKHPEYSSDLYEFLSFLIASELDINHLEDSDMAATQEWLASEGFDLIRKIVAEQQGQYSTAVKTPIKSLDETLSIKSPSVSNSASPQPQKHNTYINEAVVISVLTKEFGNTSYPLGRMRRTKLTYLHHRHCEGEAAGFMKKVAGPYNPAIRYKGPESIALKNSYVTEHQSGRFRGFVAGDNISEAEGYFNDWYGIETLEWLKQFERKTNDQLELLTTVDMAMVELQAQNQQISVDNVKALIVNNREWAPKLKRPIFSDRNIEAAILEVTRLFG